MKILRYVMMAALILGVSGIAHAFSWNLQDPPGGSAFFQVTPGVPFSFQFADCNVTVGGIAYTGCANGQNISDQTLTTIEFSFENTPALDGAAPECVSDAFSDLSCTLSSDGSEYILTFNDDCGSKTCGIPPGNLFNIYENALPGSQFPLVDGVASATPEPSSIWLALSGMGSLGYVVRRRRRSSSR